MYVYIYTSHLLPHLCTLILYNYAPSESATDNNKKKLKEERKAKKKEGGGVIMNLFFFGLLNRTMHVLLATTMMLLIFFNNPVIILARPQDLDDIRLAELPRRKLVLSQEEQIAKWKSQIGSMCSYQSVRFIFCSFFFFCC